MSENPTENDNWQLQNKPTFADVETLALELCKEYSNDKFFEWYCLVVNILGTERISAIRAMYSDHKDKEMAAKLFSARASQEAKSRVGISKYQALKSQHGRRS